MHDARGWEPASGKAPHPLPGDMGLVAAAAEAALPQPDHAAMEGFQSGEIQGHSVVAVVPAEDRSQPLPHLRNGFVPAPSESLLHLPELGPKPLTHGLPYKRKTPFPRLPANVSEAEEVERLGLAPSVPPATLSRVTAELDQAGLFGMQFQSEPRKTIAQFSPEPPGFPFVLKAHDDVVGIANDDHVAVRMPPPRTGPEVEDIVQVHVRK